jgi:glycosyltransferase involved in cell wall biosynthesis
MSDVPKGLRKHIGSAVLRVFAWGKQHVGLTQVYTRLPLSWRLAIRRRLHGTSGVPMPVFPFGDVKKLATSIDSAHQATSPGVNLLGYASGEFGIAENVRLYARALERAGHPFVIVDLDAGTVGRQTDRSMERHFADTLRHVDNVFFLNPEQLAIARRMLGRNAFVDRHNIGFWVWELERFPREWRGAFDWVDEVWTPSTFARDAIGAATDKPVLCMPTAVEFEPPSGMERAYFGLPRDAFVFLFSYDFNSFVARKNPEAVIAAFRQAFSDGVQGVRLLVKSTNGHVFSDRLAELEHAAAGDPRIEVRDGFLSRQEMFGLQNNVDCYVSLHRAEGFGLGMAECMYLGKPVIATGYSGNLDFMNRGNSLLVDYNMVPLHEGDYMCWRGQSWAEPDVAHAGRLMRQVFDDRALARRVGASAAASIRRTHSYAVCAAALARRLREIDGHNTAA